MAPDNPNAPPTPEDWELLDLDSDATLGEIHRAFRRRKAIYEPNALATYNLFGDDERGEIVTRLEGAYARILHSRSDQPLPPSLPTQRAAGPEPLPDEDAGAPPEPDEAPTPDAPPAPSPADEAPQAESSAEAPSATAAEPPPPQEAPSSEPAPPAASDAAPDEAPPPDEAPAPFTPVPIDKAIAPLRPLKAPEQAAVTSAPTIRASGAASSLSLDIPPDPAETPGAHLRYHREALGLTFEEVAEMIRIRRGHLEAIEEEAFDRLPPRVYVRGFVHQYAKVLGLPEPEALTAHFLAHMSRA